MRKENRTMYEPEKPVDHDAERALLSSTIISNEVVGDLIAAGVTEETFFDGTHKDMWKIVARLYSEGCMFDELGVAMELKEDGYIGEALPKVNSISMALETTVSMPIYLQAALRTEKLRKLCLGAYSVLDSIRRQEDPEKIQSELTASLQNEVGAVSDCDIQAVTQKVIEDLKERNSKKTKFVGVSTGFPLMDYYIGGFRPGSLNIIAGRAKAGKSSFMLQIALNMLLQNIPCRIWSLEMSEEQLLSKMVANLSEVDPNRAKDGLLTDRDYDAMERARYRLTSMPLMISDVANVTTDRIAAQHRRDIAKYGDTVCIIDYLQLIRSLDRKLSREQQVATMSRDLKLLFKDTHSVGIVLAQLNRQAETEEPKPSHLRESGSIEQDLDSLIFVYEKGTKVKIGANRHGPTGVLNFEFLGSISKFNQK